MKTRVLTVSSLLRETGRRSSREVPFIRLCGVWVEDAGFEPGDSIRVEVEYGRLIITKVTEDGTPVEPGRDPSEFEFMHTIQDRPTEKRSS